LLPLGRFKVLQISLILKLFKGVFADSLFVDLLRKQGCDISGENILIPLF
jgi:hypothetical protein